MKKKLISILVLVTAISLTGCSSSKNESFNENIDNSVDVSIESGENVEDTLYEQFNALLPRVQQRLEDNHIDYEFLENNIKDSKYSGFKSILATDANEPWSYTDISYNLGFSLDNKIEDVRLVMFLVVDSDEIKINGFKLENTLFYDMSNILIKDGIDYSDTNNKINELYNSGEEDKIINTYGNIKEVISVAHDYIGYSISIYA